MAVTVAVTFQGLDPSPALREDIERRAHHLARFAPRLQACDIVVRREHALHRHGNRYLVQLEASLPGAELVSEKAHEDPYLAARLAFDALRRRLEDHVRVQRGDVKTHDRGPGAGAA